MDDAIKKKVNEHEEHICALHYSIYDKYKGCNVNIDSNLGVNIYASLEYLYIYEDTMSTT